MSRQQRRLGSGRSRVVMRHLALAVLLGMVLNVGIAWWCAAFSQVGAMFGQSVRPSMPPGQTAPGYGSLAPERLEWGCPVPRDWPAPAFIASSDGRGIAWRGGRVTPPVGWPIPESRIATGVFCGWPMHSLYWGEAVVMDSALIIVDEQSWSETETALKAWQRRGLALPASYNSKSAWLYQLGPNQRRLPLEPVWPGFAINVLVFAVAAWFCTGAPFLCFRSWRRRRRVRNGWCSSCGYAIHELTLCPECGAPARA